MAWGDSSVGLLGGNVLESLDGVQEERYTSVGEALEDVEERNPVLSSSGVEGNSIVNESLGDLAVSAEVSLDNLSHLDEASLLRSGGSEGKSSHGGNGELGERDHW